MCHLFFLAIIFFRGIKTDYVFLLAILFTLIWQVQSIVNNYASDNYYPNFYSIVLSLFGWAIYIQSVYLKIPGIKPIKFVSVYGVNILLILIFAFGYHIDEIAQSMPFDEGTLYLAGLLIAMAMMYYLENIIRCLKSEYRFVYKHMIFWLAIIAGVNLLTLYQLLLQEELSLFLHYLSLLVYVPLPLFLFISINRSSKAMTSHFNQDNTNQLQYFLILAGIVLIIAGILRMIDLYFSQVLSEFYQAIFFIILLTIGGALFLSNFLRSELSLFLRSYFYGDPNDYKKEWDNVSRITRNEAGIYLRILDYYQQRVNAHQSALYLYQQGRMSKMVSTDNGFADSLDDLDTILNEATQISNGIFASIGASPEDNDLYITLNVEGDLIGVCWLRLNTKTINLDEASIQLYQTVSAEFAIRLWEIRHKTENQRKEKLAAFNKTVAFLAHDLKNIVAQQQLAYENFNKYKSDPDFLDDFHETIGHSTQRLVNLISQLRYKSLNPTKNSASFDKLVDFIEQQVRLAKGRIIFIYENPENKNPTLDTNVTVVVENLLKNAVEASQPEQVVEISVVLNQDLHIDVNDSGEGMKQTFIENKLFEPFSSSRRDHGLGVGMYHVKTILDEMNGKIDISSVPGEGTQVRVVIPI